METLIANVNRLRRREGKRPCTRVQEGMIRQQVLMRAELGRFTLFPEALAATRRKEGVFEPGSVAHTSRTGTPTIKIIEERVE